MSHEIGKGKHMREIERNLTVIDIFISHGNVRRMLVLDPCS